MKRKLTFLLAALLLLGACSQPKPLVGVSCARSSSGSTQLSRTYTDAIRRAGGIAVVLPTVSDAETAAELVARLDGIVFSGGEDLDPSWYGETVWNETVKVDTLRDRSDSLLGRAALASGKPILAICRGEQLMNVLLGGSLYQDLPSQRADSPVVHGGGAWHKIGVEAGSLLARLYGTDSLMVNSFHHQAVKRPAPGITITARASDGTVEAFETPQVWAFQFHPEKMVTDDADWLALFTAYVDRLR